MHVHSLQIGVTGTKPSGAYRLSTLEAGTGGSLVGSQPVLHRNALFSLATMKTKRKRRRRWRGNRLVNNSQLIATLGLDG